MPDKRIIEEGGTWAELTLVGGTKELQPKQDNFVTDESRYAFRDASNVWHRFLDSIDAPQSGYVPYASHADNDRMITNTTPLFIDSSDRFGVNRTTGMTVACVIGATGSATSIMQLENYQNDAMLFGIIDGENAFIKPDANVLGIGNKMGGTYDWTDTGNLLTGIQLNTGTSIISRDAKEQRILCNAIYDDQYEYMSTDSVTMALFNEDALTWSYAGSNAIGSVITWLEAARFGSAGLILNAASAAITPGIRAKTSGNSYAFHMDTAGAKVAVGIGLQASASYPLAVELVTNRLEFEDCDYDATLSTLGNLVGLLKLRLETNQTVYVPCYDAIT